MIYLDYNATTPIDKPVADAMQALLRENYGNPSSTHEYGLAAKKIVENARWQVATLLGAKSSEIVFTSGGSESNNTVIKGVAHSFCERGNHIITSQIEHPAVLNPCNFLEKQGYQITHVPVDCFGIIDPVDIEKAITPKTILVTIMHANNETGSLQPISDIATICQKQGVLFHTDAAQSVGKIPVGVNELGVDFLTVAGHKLYAPKGIGALYIRDGVTIEPLIHGAGHEGGRRAGTENVIFDAGLGCACQLAQFLLDDHTVGELTQRFYHELSKAFGSCIRLNGHPKNRLPNTLNISFLGSGQVAVQKALARVATSAGSACHAGSVTISPVLRAMGIMPDELGTVVRFSLGRFTTQHDIDTVLDDLSMLVSGQACV